MEERNYEVIQEGGAPIKAWVKGVEFEEEARQQVINVSKMPFIYKHVAIMSDCHWGMGATIGSVIPTKGAIIPAAVGVDIGCLDAETEFLTPFGWKKINKYEEDDQVCIVDPQNMKGRFAKPLEYVDLPSDGFYRIKTKYGVDQMLSPEHRVLSFCYDRSYSFVAQRVDSAQQVAEKHAETVLGWRHRFLTAFNLVIEGGMDISDEDLRVSIMVSADGHITNKNTKRCVLRFKKDRKISRAVRLLQEAEIAYSHYSGGRGSTELSFRSPTLKGLDQFWGKLSSHQLRIVVDEIFNWDGNIQDHVFYTRKEEEANFVQFAITATNKRAVLRRDERDDGIDYRVFMHDNIKVGIDGTPKTSIEWLPPRSGERKFCFKVQTGFFVIRRNGKVAVTGNCGMQAVKTNWGDRDLPDNLRGIRNAIEAVIPHGRTNNGRTGDRGAWSEPDKGVELAWSAECWTETFAKIVEKHPKIGGANSIKHLGTLGTGNHFIEICLDEEKCVWVMLHSGSRGVGNRIGSYFISLAKKDMEKWMINLPDKNLAYLPEGTDHFDDYVEAVEWAQQFAKVNRWLMMNRVLAAMEHETNIHCYGRESVIDCHHNYVTRENHFGANIFVTRKGAVRAREGDYGIIPGSMGVRSYIVRGKGNRDSFNSCSHGAGRRMSRTEAKKRFTLSDHISATAGVECRKDIDVIDETPSAYKSIGAVMAAQKDLVDIVHTLKQVVCVKG